MSTYIHQEEQCHDTVSAALRDALRYFAKGAVVTSDGTLPPRVDPLTVAQATDLLEVYTTLLVASTTSESRLALLHRTFHSPMFSTLTALVAQPLLFAPDVSAGYSLQQTFAQLRIAAIQAINKVVMFAADAEAAAGACVRAVLEFRFVEALLQLLSSPATFETLRVAASESIFILVLRLPESRAHVVQTEALQMIFNCLVLEPAATARNFFCSAVREIVSTHPTSIGDPKMFEVLTKLMCLDESPDVRTLSAEIVTAVLQAPQATVTAASLVSAPGDLLAAVRDRLEKDESAAVVEAQATLFEALIVAAVTVARSPSALFDACARLHLERSLVGGLTQAPRAAAACARALRFLLQLAPPEQQVGYRLVTHFQTLSSLLKVAMDLTAPREDSADGAYRVLCVEVGLAVSMLLAQSPVYRQQVMKELHAFPMWAQTLRDGLAAFLHMASLDYYDKIVLLDCTGTELNALAGVEWGSNNKPKKSVIRGIFAAQEQRVREQRVDRGYISPPPTMEQEVRRKQRLTFIVLVYAVHLALDDLDDGSSVTAGLHAGNISGNLSAAATPRGRAATAAAAAGEVPPGAADFGVSPAASRRTGSTPRVSALPKFPAQSTPRARTPGRGGGAAVADGLNATATSIASRAHLSPREREEMIHAYDKFDSGFKLILDLAQLYGRKQRQEAQYVPTPDGFVVRQDRLRNPWGPLVKRESLKSWTVADLKEGDIFYFSLPFDELGVAPVKILIEKARRHCALVKKNMVTTPQTARGRRWFLYDMLHHVMPKVIEALEELLALVREHGGDNVRFPLFLFREKEMHLGERAVHSGNLLQVIDQVKFYMAQNPNELVGVSASYLQHIQEKMERLQRGDGAISPVASDSDDDGGGAGDGHGHGHGGISSESDND